MTKSEKCLWLFLLKNGAVTKEWSFYGNSFSTNKKETQKMWEDISKNGICWEDMDNCQDSYKDSFQGTFQESATTEIITGTLITNSGNEYELKMVKDEDITILDIVLEMINIGEIDTTAVINKIIKEKTLN